MNGTSFLSKLPSCTALPTTKEKRKSESIKIVKITFGVSRSTTTAGSRCTMITKWFPIYGIKSCRIASFCLVSTRAKVFTAVDVVLGEGEGNLLHLFTPDRLADFRLKNLSWEPSRVRQKFETDFGPTQGPSIKHVAWSLLCKREMCHGSCISWLVFLHARLTPAERRVSGKSCHGSDIPISQKRQPCTHKHHYAE